MWMKPPEELHELLVCAGMSVCVSHFSIQSYIIKQYGLDIYTSPPRPPFAFSYSCRKTVMILKKSTLNH